jgi:uncharacterized membrane protein YccC
MRLGTSLRIDPSALRPAAAAKAAVGVVIPLIAGMAAGFPTAGATAAFGALTVGIATVVAAPRVPVGTLLAATVGMGAATFIGSLSGLVMPVHLLVLAAAGFLGGSLVAAGRGATQVGVNAIIALLIFGRHAAGPDLAALHASWVMAGGLVQTVLAVALRSPRPLQRQREALAAGYEGLAQNIERPPSLQSGEAADAAREALRPLLQTTDVLTAEPLLGLADQLDRIRQELHALHYQRAALTEQTDLCRQIDAGLTLIADALSQVASALRQRRAPSSVEASAAKLLELADDLGKGEPGRQGQWPAVRFASARIAALAGQLRAVDRMTAQVAGTRRFSLAVTASYAADAIVVLPGQLLSAAEDIWAAMSPSSPAFRHAVRLAVVVPLATEISRLLPWPRAYWLPLAAVIVLKPDFTATIGRGVARTVGTAIGLLAAASMVVAVHPQGVAFVALIAVCAWLGYTVFVANYAIWAIFLTALVILLVSTAGTSEISTVENRGFDTLIGGAIAIVAYLVWPTWEAKTLQAATADRFEAIRRFLGAVLEVYVEPQAFDRAALARLAAATRRAQSSVTASLQRAEGEPARIRPDIEGYADVLVAGRRIAAGTHALASQLQDAKTHVAVPKAAVITGQIDAAMSEIVRSIESGDRPHPAPDLRQSQRQLAAEAAAGTTPTQRRGAILAALLDPLVNSIDTASDLLAHWPQRPA